jgi:hypothetical protein
VTEFQAWILRMDHRDRSTTGWIAGWPDKESIDRWMNATGVAVRFSLRMSFRFDVALHHMNIWCWIGLFMIRMGELYLGLFIHYIFMFCILISQ